MVGCSIILILFTHEYTNVDLLMYVEIVGM
jgi:hypothetical protein